MISKKLLLPTLIFSLVIGPSSFAATTDYTMPTSQSTTVETTTDVPPSNTSTTTDMPKTNNVNGAMSTTVSDTSMNNVERNKKNARTWYEEVVIKNNQQPLDVILSKDVVLQLAPSYKSPLNNSNMVTGIDQVKKHIAKVNETHKFSGDVIYLVGEGNHVAMYRVVTDTPANGPSTTVPWATFFEFDNDGKITKMTHVNDTLLEKQQLENGNNHNQTNGTSRTI